MVLHSTASVKASGHVFDDSRTKGTAYTVAVGVNQAIQGMDKALQQMRKGCRRVLLMTSDEAYGELGLKPHVPPNADVVYDVEVLAVNESLVAQGMRVRREEEERIQRFLRLQDAERAYEVTATWIHRFPPIKCFLHYRLVPRLRRRRNRLLNMAHREKRAKTLAMGQAVTTVAGICAHAGIVLVISQGALTE